MHSELAKVRSVVRAALRAALHEHGTACVLHAVLHSHSTGVRRNAPTKRWACRMIKRRASKLLPREALPKPGAGGAVLASDVNVACTGVASRL